MDKAQTSAVKASVKRPRRLHHAAWVTRDMEATRHFYEDVLGLPLVATWAERAPLGGGNVREYVHTFFAFADGGALALRVYVHPLEENKRRAAAQLDQVIGGARGR